MRAYMMLPILLSATLASAGRAKPQPPPPPGVDALELENGAILLEQPPSFDRGTADGSAYQLTDGRDKQGAWSSPEGAPIGAAFVWELDGRWRLDTLALSNKGVGEKDYPGVSTKTVELFTALGTGPWTSVGRYTVGRRAARELALPPGTFATRVRIVVLENHGNAMYTELSEASLLGERVISNPSVKLDGNFALERGPIRFAQHGDHVSGCFIGDDGKTVFVTGSMQGRVAHVMWREEDGAHTAAFAMSASGDRVYGVTGHGTAFDDELAGLRVSKDRGAACEPTEAPLPVAGPTTTSAI
jgi:hypothetical protein